MTPETARQLRALIDAHDDMIGAIRPANRGNGEANQAFGEAIQAHDDAIQAVVAANRAALELLARLEAGE